MEKRRTDFGISGKIYECLFIVLLVRSVACGPLEGSPCAGQAIGVETPADFTDNIDSGSGKAYLMTGPSLLIPCCGVLTKWRFYTKAAGDIKAQIWRSDELRGESEYLGLPADQDFEGDVAIADQVSVQSGDMIGWFNSGAETIPYNTVIPGAEGIKSQPGPTPAVGGTLTWSGAEVDDQRYAFGAQVDASMAPSFTSIPTTETIDVEKTGVVHTLTYDDVNKDDVLEVSLVGTSDEFELDPTTGEVSVKGKLAVQNYTLTFLVKDQCEMSSTAILTIFVSNSNPNITSLPIAAFKLAEHTTTKTSVHNLTYTDDGPLANVDCRFTVDPAGAPFEMEHLDDPDDDPAKPKYEVFFVPSAGPALDFDTTSLYRFNFTCNDGTSDSVTRPFEVSVEKNEDPVLDPATNPAEITVDASTTDKSDVVHTVTATDGGDGGDLTFTMHDCPGPFEMAPNGEIYATENLNAHRESPYVCTYNVTDEWNTVGPRTVTIKIDNINHPPNISSPSVALPKYGESSFYENTGAGFLVDTIAGVDIDGDTLTYEAEWVDGLGAEYFDFDPDTGEITTKEDMNYEDILRSVGEVFSVDVRAWDGREFSDIKRLEMTLKNENEPPEFKHPLYTLDAEEGGAGVVLGCPYFDVKDPDIGDVHTYTLDCGASGVFQIDGKSVSCSAIIRMLAEYDLDTPPRTFEDVTCTVTVEDKEGLTDTATLVITVKEIDDNWPDLAQPDYDFFHTNATTAGTIIGNIGTTTDIDVLAENRRHTYTLDGTSDYGIDDQGNIYTRRDFTGEIPRPLPTFRVTVTDEAGHSDTSSVTVTITEAPTTTTSTTTTTQFPPVYDSIDGFFSDVGNVSWFVAAMILSALLLGLMTYMCVRCFSSNACSAMRCMDGNCFGGRRVGANPRPHAHGRPQKPHKPQKPQKPQQQPRRRNPFEDCCKREQKQPKAPKAKDPAKPDEGRLWEAWKDDFQTKNWVG